MARKKNARENSRKEAGRAQPEPVTSDGDFAEQTEGCAPGAEKREPSFPIVGIGASAGGLTAFEAFFANMPGDTESGMAYVIVQHLDPSHKSILSDLVRRYTRMKVFDVTDGMVVQPNCTYIIQPNKDMALIKGRLHLMEPAAPRGLRLPIDFFFRSLAEDRGEQSVCIVLSGTGTDGTLGLRAVKAAGGMVMVQETESADYDGMPRSALATGLADFVLPPKEMPAQLLAYVEHAFGRKTRAVAPPLPEMAAWLPKVTELLRTRTGHDFSSYKRNTVRRRVERRMAVHQLERLDHYVRYLKENAGEVDALFRELLIGVTGFFRDPEAFEILQNKVIPHLFADRPAGASIRVWVPGCSTGEEAYSLAILLQEHAEKVAREFNIQVFATDIDQDAIEKARSGVYPSNIAADVTPERLARFFAPEGDSFYRIKKSTRDLLVFAEQDVIRDPPFSRIHLLSCRNLLIYLESDLQKKLVPLFHYALNPGGFLLLGGSETTGEFNDLFEVIDRKWKLYQRSEASLPLLAEVAIPITPLLRERGQSAGAKEGQKERKAGVREVTEKVLLDEYAPTCITSMSGAKFFTFTEKRANISNWLPGR